MKRVCHIVLFLLVALTACRGPRVIPRDTLTDIYFEMFMVDQQIRDNGYSSAMLDTLLVYEPVFEKYGYDTDDYLHSVRFYLKDPERFAKVFEDVSERLIAEAKALDPVIELRKQLAGYRVERSARTDSVLALFSADSMSRGPVRVVRDTSRYGAWFRLSAIRSDTLRVPGDSLKAAADTLAKDSLLVETPAEPEETPAENPEVKPARVNPKPEKLRPRSLPERELPRELVEEAVEEETEQEEAL